ncbi:MAG: DUF4857 domain-containing protein [Patescibacteria group bacterium]|nr:DUF4857 domain-containing protein [Patescibacteria group bacterium]
MLNKISRYIIILLIVIIGAVYLPNFYWMVFQKSTSSPSIYYSAVKNEFVYKTWNRLTGSKRFDSEGNELTDKEYRKALPFYYHNDLAKWNELPDSVKSFEFDRKKVKKEMQMVRINAKDFNDPLIQLWPLIESKPKYSRLSMPEEVFRITDRIEFINPAENKIIEDMSNEFTDAMLKEGFEFPSKFIFGNPTTRKSFDEGYFIVDNKNETYHLKKIDGKPFCVKTSIPNNLDIKRMFVKEDTRKEFYGLLFTNSNDVYLITYDNYKLIKLPLQNYDSDKMKFIFIADPLNRTIKFSDDDKSISVVTDRNYKLIDKFKIGSTAKENTITGKIERSLFPFKINTYSSNSHYVNFDFTINYLFGIISIVFSLIVFFIINRKKQYNYKENWFDIVIIALTGIYGLIAVLIIKPGYWD